MEVGGIAMRMRSGIWIAATVLLACVVGAFSQTQVQQNVPTFSVSVDLVKVPITVFGLNGAPIQELSRDDFRVYEDGQPQEIRNFNIDSNPVSVILLLDTSGTVTKEWKQIKEAAEGFSEALAKGDRISVITFSDEVELTMDWSDDAKQVHRALGKVQLGLRTDLYDAIFESAQTQLKDIDGRKAIILLTDFLNNQSIVGYQEAVQAVVQSQASLYIVSKTMMVREAARTQRRVVILNDIYQRLFGDRNYIDEFFDKKETQMTELAEKTGGRCYFPADYNQIKGVYKQVAQELRNQHYLTYVSESTKPVNSYHNIRIDYLQPASKLIYRKGYYFKPSPLFSPRESLRQR
jgi:Ca-activated chloride channel family protein